MPQVIALQNIPKQSLSIVLDGLQYDINVLSTNGCMSLDIIRATETVVLGQRVVAGQLVIPYAKLEELHGNFVFLTQNGDLPDYTKFQNTQTFLYGSNEELAAVRPPVTS